MLKLSIMEDAMAATVAPVSRTTIPGLPLPDLYARVSRHVPAIEWPALAPDIEAMRNSFWSFPWPLQAR